MPFGGYFRAATGCLGLVLGLAAGVPQSATAQTVPSQLPNLIQGVLEQYRNAPPPMAAPMPAPQQQPSQGNAASSAWLAVDPRVTGCLRDSYRIDAQAYAASGIGPSDPRVAGYVSQCNEKITREVKLEWKKYYATQEWEKLDPRVASCLQSRFKINIAQLEAKGLGPRDKPVLLKQCETIVAEEKSKPNKPKETQTARDTEPAGKPDAEIVFWESIRSSVSADEYREYLKRYPEGQFATIAHLRIEELQKQASPHKEAAAPSAITGRRVALIVGNAGYKHVPYLDNPTHDARLIAATLQSLGFELVEGEARLDLDRAAFVRALAAFGEAAAKADVALFYYSGHGIQFDGANFLVPIDANPTKRSDADIQLVDAETVLHQMQDANAKLKIVMLDACRNNPFAGNARAVGRGLGQMQAPEGAVISYATQPGNLAQDGGAGGNSPYAAALAQAMNERGLDIFQMFNRVAVLVADKTQHEQQPWSSFSPISGDFYFAGK